MSMIETHRRMNSMKQQHRRPFRNAISATGPSVGFLSAAFATFGGTETFHRTLIPRLRRRVNVIGFVATRYLGGDGILLKVPYATGLGAARELAEQSDIVVTWGIDCLRDVLPRSRPKVISAHHSDWSSEWSNALTLSQLDLVDEIVCVNEDVSRRIKACCRKPTHYIPNAIDPARILPSGQQSQLRSQFRIAPESKIVLFGHRLSLEKRPALAVAIATRLPPDWVMVIAGDGAEKTKIEKLAADCDRVRVVGRVESLADWLSISACFLSSSSYDGFGLAIGEAMLAGVPTVSTPVGIAPGLAITLPADSTASAWAAAISDSAAWIQPAGMADRFSVDRMVSAWADVLKIG